MDRRRWIRNPKIETQEEFDRRVTLNNTAPWEDQTIKEKIKQENADKSHIVYKPVDLHNLIDATG
jgi:hypothetical protein